jgi:RimJ/RimL family protein N-acetyltransferase
MFTLETERLLIRPLVLADLAPKHTMEQHPDVYEYNGFVQLEGGMKRARTLEETRWHLERRIAEFELQGFGQMALTRKPNGAFVGWAGLQFYLLDHGVYSTPEIELFYGLAREYWGQGLATEAGQALIRYGFETLKLSRITSVAFRENVRSASIMRRVGMTVGPHPSNAEEVLGVIQNPQHTVSSEHIGWNRA